MKPILEINQLTKEFRRGEYIEYGSFRDTLTGLFRKKTIKRKDTFKALDNISFSINEGEAVGIIGKNGAGKSTLLKILSRITPPSKGQFIMRGNVASLLEVGTGFHSELTGRENIYFNGSLLGLSKERIRKNFDSIIDFAGIDNFIDTPLKRYSSGMYVRLAFAVAAHIEPDILIVDEVLAVGDLAFQKKCIGKMDEVAKEGRTVIFVSHQMEMVEKLCNRGILINEGKVLLDGSVRTVVDAYIESNEELLTTENFSSIRPPFSDLYFTKLEFFNDSGELKKVFRPGKACTFRLHYQCPTSIEGFVFWTNIYDSRFTPVAQFFTGSLKEHIFKVNHEKGYLDLLVDQLSLIPGTYTVELVIHHKSIVKDHIPRAATFEVAFDDYYGSGVLPNIGTLMQYKING